MMQTQTLRVADADAQAVDQPADQRASEGVDGDLSIPTVGTTSYYADARDVDYSEYDNHNTFPRFITAVLDELGKDFTSDDARLVDEIPAAETDDVHFGILLAYPDESLMFVGSDPTAKDAVPWFAFTIEPTEPLPAPESARDALDLLKPPEVRDVVAEDDWLPDRHGEWWLLPSQLVPAGTVFQPGVQSTPYWPSPLGNHVPREYAFTVSDGEFMDRFTQHVSSVPSTVETPPEAIEWSWRQLQKAAPPDDAPSWADIRSFAGDVIVRGTVRHRDDDHYVENLGDVWHKAVTHDVEVYTGDDAAERVHLDYHGR